MTNKQAGGFRISMEEISHPKLLEYLDELLNRSMRGQVVKIHFEDWVVGCWDGKEKEFSRKRRGLFQGK